MKGYSIGQLNLAHSKSIISGSLEYFSGRMESAGPAYCAPSLPSKHFLRCLARSPLTLAQDSWRRMHLRKLSRERHSHIDQIQSSTLIVCSIQHGVSRKEDHGGLRYTCTNYCRRVAIQQARSRPVKVVCPSRSTLATCLFNSSTLFALKIVQPWRTTE